MQPLTITRSSITPYSLDLQRSFTFAGTIISQRVGYIVDISASNGMKAQGEIAPLPGVSAETLKKARHDLVEAQAHLNNFSVVLEKDDLIASLAAPVFAGLCPSVRFGIESAVLGLAAAASGPTGRSFRPVGPTGPEGPGGACGISLAEFLGANLQDVATAGLLQGSHEQILTDARELTGRGYQVFKLKVGDRNIPLDVKKVQDLRTVIGPQGSIRLDGNRVWSLREAMLFIDLAGRAQIEFIEEPLSDMSKTAEFYQATHLPIALDESLGMADSEAVKFYVLKPTVLGLIPCLAWIDHARRNGKKAIISAAFESPVGMKVLANLACLTAKAAGLGTERWLKGVEPLADAGGIIRKERLQ